IKRLDNGVLIKLPIIKTQKHKIEKKNKLIHIAAFTYGNAGDAVLPTAVRDSIEQDNAYNWQGVHAHTVVTDDLITSFNRTKGIIIGGGGLFLKDTNPNNLSGWQWS